MVKLVRGSALLVPLLLLACTVAPRVQQATTFAVPAEHRTIYVVPFVTVMVPLEVEEGIFDRFVDALNAGDSSGHEFVILKEEAAVGDSAWLAQQAYLTGEIFGYVEDRGCCSTVIRLKSRLELHQPGAEAPTLRIDYPREAFFDHDRSTVEEERRRLSDDIASTLARRLLDALRPD